MIEKLRVQLKQYMDAQNLSAHALEKKAGLKSCVISNFVSGRSKNPTFETIAIIANTLGCSVADLLGEPKRAYSLINKDSGDDLSVDFALFEKVIAAVIERLLDSKMNISLGTTFSLIQEAYVYCLKKPNKDLDAHFIEWLVDKVR